MTRFSMHYFEWIYSQREKKWIILAPRRAERPQEDGAKKSQIQQKLTFCPFCPGREEDEKEVFGIGGKSQTDDRWQVRVIPNKYPFAKIHQVIIHSPDHHKNFDELPQEQNELILKTYRHQYNENSHSGNVYIFHNHGEGAGESLPHPHTQLVVIPFEVTHSIPKLESVMLNSRLHLPSARADGGQGFQHLVNSSKEMPNQVIGPKRARHDKVETAHFQLFCPEFSQWPDEVWVNPKKRNRSFGEITDKEIADFSYVLSRLIKIFTLRYGHSFPYNFYIYPGYDWYLRLIPRIRILGGFEVGTGIFVNTEDPKETFVFIKEHFENPDEEKIKREHQAKYHKTI